jgi:hypothetical protein
LTNSKPFLSGVRAIDFFGCDTVLDFACVHKLVAIGHEGLLRRARRWPDHRAIYSRC